MLKIVFLDIDGVILNTKSTWQSIHEALNTIKDRRLEKYRSDFFSGKIPYQEWADLEASLWRGTPYLTVEEAVMSIPFIPGAEYTVRKLLEKGIEVIALSSGIPLKTLSIKLGGLGLKNILANDLVLDGALVSGKVSVLVPYNGKRRLVEEILNIREVSYSDCCIIGDGENDIPLFELIDNSVAFNTDNKLVKAKAKYVSESTNLKDILKYLYTQSKTNRI
mgnify:FL=1